MRRIAIVNKITEKIRKLPPGAYAILYGSEARGDAQPDSDVDLLIVVDQNEITENERQAIINPLFDIEYETGVLINPIVLLKKQWGNPVTPFYTNVINEGIVL